MVIGTLTQLLFVDIDKETFQHVKYSVKYPNVFAIGDCSSGPTLKTVDGNKHFEEPYTKYEHGEPKRKKVDRERKKPCQIPDIFGLGS